MPDIRIVPYEPRFRGAVRRCVYETGFGGKTVAPFFEDPEFFADYLCNYYTDREPESAFIPLVDGEPAGYLLGSVDTLRCNRIFEKEIRPAIFRRLLLGQYKNIGPSARRYIYRAVLQMIRRESIAPPVDKYPAHLHIDLFPQFRRMGVGGRLVNTWLDVLREKHIPGIHLGTSSFHVEAIPFYEKLGFRRFKTIRLTSSYFQEASDKDFYDICFIKDLS
jgi:ribosomal protein S18 acetylase RimI-like enzyme